MNPLILVVSLTWFFFNRELNQFYFSKFLVRYRNNENYFRLLLLLSSDNSLNTRPINGYQPHNNEQWTVFKKRGLYFVHININSLLTKIDDELQYITKLSEVAVIGISQSKLDDSVLSSEIENENYNHLALLAIDTVVVLLVSQEIIYLTTRNFFFPLTWKIYSHKLFYYIQSLLLWVPFIVHQAKAVLLK